METIGQRIKRLRKNNNLTQNELAKKVNKSAQVVSNWEREYTDPDHEDIIKLSLALNVKSDYILFGEENPIQSTFQVFSSRLSKGLKNANITIEEAAYKCDVTPQYINQLINKNKEIPGNLTLNKLANIIGVTRDYLLGYTDNHKGYGNQSYDTDPTDLKEILESQGPLMYDGVPISDEQKEKLALLMRQAYYIVKEENKKEAAKRKKKTE